MKTAQEMYQYCLDNNFGKGDTKKKSLKHFALIEQSLAEDEKAIVCFIGLHNYISATKHDYNYAYAITNKRVVMAQQKLMGQNLQTVSINNLNDITLKKGLVSGTITIDTIKETFNVNMNAKDAQNLNNIIHDVLLTLQQEKSSTPIQQAPTDSSADEILKYKNLLDAGAISQEEYDIKKKQLLGL